ncbi:MAG: hypothetical protein JOZ96_24385 [Acidobacteria bacterium]|nr:hypothetical protein [Acidobacteriota bacterium]
MFRKTVPSLFALFATLLMGAPYLRAQSAGTKPVYPIRFKPCAKTAAVEGRVSPPAGEGDMHDPGSEKYALGVRAGQRVTLKVSSDNRGAVFSLFKQTPGGPEPVAGAAGVRRWSGALAGGGDYTITVSTRSRAAGSRFRLTVTLRQAVEREALSEVTP